MICLQIVNYEERWFKQNQKVIKQSLLQTIQSELMDKNGAECIGNYKKSFLSEMFMTENYYLSFY